MIDSECHESKNVVRNDSKIAARLTDTAFDDSKLATRRPRCQ